jgi:uncharacterized protein YecE (DUF72 family)
MNIFVGTAGFFYKDWEGIVYPADLKKRKIHPLEYLAQYFDCCEINTSFYGHIRRNVGKSWCEKAAAVNPGFQFTAKLFQEFNTCPKAPRRHRLLSSRSVQTTKNSQEKGWIRLRRKTGWEQSSFNFRSHSKMKTTPAITCLA